MEVALRIPNFLKPLTVFFGLKNIFIASFNKNVAKLYVISKKKRIFAPNFEKILEKFNK